MLKGFSRLRDIAKERALQFEENQVAIVEQNKMMKNAIGAMELHKLLSQRLGIFVYCSSPTIDIDGIRFTSYVANKGENIIPGTPETWDLQAIYILRSDEEGLLNDAPTHIRFMRSVRNMEEVGQWIKSVEDYIAHKKAASTGEES